MCDLVGKRLGTEAEGRASAPLMADEKNTIKNRMDKSKPAASGDTAQIA